MADKPPGSTVDAAIAATAAELRDRFTAVEAERDKVYRERAALVAFLAACYPAEIWTDTDGGGWDVVAVETPAGQMSWHIAQHDMDLFPHVVLRSDEDRYDGHTTEAKYERLADMTDRIVRAGGLAGVIASMAKPERSEPYPTAVERDELRAKVTSLRSIVAEADDYAERQTVPAPDVRAGWRERARIIPEECNCPCHGDTLSGICGTCCAPGEPEDAKAGVTP